MRSNVTLLVALIGLVGLAATGRADPPPANERGQYEQALQRYRAVGDRQGELRVLKAIRTAQYDRKQFDQVVVTAEQALAIQRELHDRAGEAIELRELGVARVELQQLPQALVAFKAAHAIQRELGLRDELAMTLDWIGVAHGRAKQYSESLVAFREALLLHQAQRDLGKTAITLHLMGDMHLAQAQLSEAVETYERSMRARAEAGDRKGEAGARKSVGFALFLKSQDAQAVRVLRPAVALQLELGDKPKAALLLQVIATAHTRLGKRQEAIAAYQELLALQRQLGDRKGEAESLQDIAMQYVLLAQHPIALQYIREALPIQKEVGNQKGIAKCLQIIGVAGAMLGSQQQAVEVFQESLPYWRALGDRGGEAQTLHTLGSLHGALGDPQRQIDRYAQALEIWRETKNGAQEASTLLRLGAAHLTLGQYDRALDHVQRALQLHRDRADQAGQAAALGTLARIHAALDQDPQALARLQEALALQRLVGDRRGESESLQDLALRQSLLGRKAEARQNLEAALPILQGLHDRRGEAFALSWIAVFAREAGRAQEAQQTFDAALAVTRDAKDRIAEATVRLMRGDHLALAARPELAEKEYAQALSLFEAAGDRAAEQQTLVRSSQVQRQLGKYAAAVASLRRATTILEETRASLRATTAKMAYVGRELDAPALLVGLLAELAQDGAGNQNQAAPPFALPEAGTDYVTAALHYHERWKARTLVELLARARGAEWRAPIDPRTLDEERTLLGKQRSALEAQEQPDGNPDEKKQRLAETTRALGELVARMRQAKDPATRAYATLKYPDPVRVDQIPLAANEALLEYAVLDRETLLWVVERGRKARLYRLPLPAKQVTERVRDLRQLLTSSGPATARGAVVEGVPAGPDAQRRREQLQAQLYNELLAPALAELDAGKRLIVVPDQALLSLPFEVLTRPTATGSQYVGAQWAIQYYPSATALAINRQARPGAAPGPRRAVLGVGDPAYGAKFAALPATRHEILAIGKLFGMGASSPGILLGASARESTLKELGRSGELARYDYVHLATHGVLREEVPALGQAALVLSLGAAGNDDGFLTMNEILELPLHAELVVLSACQTGRGQEVRGEGVVGLTRAFLHAGTRSIVVSLWSVADESTAQLMTRFYHHLIASKLDKAEALRRARVDLMATHPHPFHWAPFVLVGER